MEISFIHRWSASHLVRASTSFSKVEARRKKRKCIRPDVKEGDGYWIIQTNGKCFKNCIGSQEAGKKMQISWAQLSTKFDGICRPLVANANCLLFKATESWRRNRSQDQGETKKPIKIELTNKRQRNTRSSLLLCVLFEKTYCLSKWEVVALAIRRLGISPLKSNIYIESKLIDEYISFASRCNIVNPKKIIIFRQNFVNIPLLSCQKNFK